MTWDTSFFDTLFGYEWQLSTSPAGAKQWVPTDPAAQDAVPDPHDPSKRHAPVMLTTDLALRMDPVYEPISRRFHENPQEFADAFAKAWFKLTHRDMGPRSRYLGPLVPSEPQLWQDPVPPVSHPLVGAQDVAALKEKILASGLSVSQLVSTAWASASTFRGTDKRGGANGARIRLAPQNGWAVNEPAQLAQVLRHAGGDPAGVRGAGQRRHADLARRPDRAGRLRRRREGREGRRLRRRGALHPGAHGRDAGADRHRVVRRARAGRGRVPQLPGQGRSRSPPSTCSSTRRACSRSRAPEMTVLVGGLRVLGANHDGSDLGVLTARKGTLTNDFFVNLLDMGTTWQPTSEAEETFEGRDRSTGETRWTASRVDLVFGSNSQLRAIAEVYASDDGQEKFVRDFVAAWDKVMSLDRFDLA